MNVTIKDQETETLILTLDASLSETHAQEAEATDHPVESGSNITDHVRPKPQMLTLEGLISNTPIVNPFTGSFAQGPFLPDQPGSAEAAHFALKQRLQAGATHIIQTKLDTYSNMLLISKNEPRSAQIGDALQFTLIFKEIRIVFNQTVTVKTAGPQHQPGTDKGKRVATPATATATQKTQAAAMWDAAKAKVAPAFGF